MTKAEYAGKLFEEGYNCSQAVLLAFCEDFNIDRDTATKLSLGLGGGVGRLREVCGAVTGMSMVLSLKYSTSDDNSENKKIVYKHVQECAEEYKKENGSIVCKELLGITQIGGVPEERTKEFYKKRPCKELVMCAAKIVDKHINS